MTASSLLAWICCLFVFLASLQQQAFAAPHNWTQQNPRVTMASLYSAAYGAGQYVVAGELEQPVVLISKDLKSWQTVATPSISVGSPFSGFYVAYGPTAGFVLVGGQSSATLTSIDGKNWQAHAQEYSPYLRQVVVYGNGLYVSAPLDGSSLYVSTNGADWQISMMPDMDFNIVGVLFNTNNGQFLVYGYGSGDDNGVIYSSVDGNVWNVFSNISSFLSYPVNQIDSITQGPGNSLLATVDIQGYGVIVYSPDGGKTWQVVYDLSNGYGFSSVSYGKGVFFAQVYSQATGEELLTSTDNGKSWSVVSSSAVAGFPQFVNGVWMVLGARGLIQTSLDGKSFVTFNQGITDQLQQFLSPPSDINSQPAFFLTFQDYTTGSPSGTYASNDGIQWKVISDRAVTLIKWSANYNAWLGLFNSQLAFSSDMVQWQTLEGPTLPPAPAKGSVYIQDFAFYNDTWAVLVTIRNEYFPVGYRVFTSRGVGPKYWDTTLSSDQLATELLAVTAGNGIFLVESSSGRFHYSLDGSNWQVSALQSSLGAAGGDQLFYVGQDGEGLLCYLPEEGLFANTSSDGLNWQTVSFGSGKKIVGIFYQEQLGGIVMSLTDGSFRAWNGKSWVMTDVIKGSGGVHNVGWHNGQLVAVNTLTNGIFTAPVVSPP